MADQFNIAKGIAGGAMSGASIGTMILPGVGTAIGAGLGAILGGAKTGSAAKEFRSALDAIQSIPEVDPTQTAFKDKLEKERRMVMSGFTTDFQVASDMLKTSQAGSHDIASKMALVNPALALSTMKVAGANFNTGTNQALGTISTRAMGYTQMMEEMVNKIAQRKLDVDVYKKNAVLGQASAEYKDVVAQNNANIASGISGLAGNIDAIKGLFGNAGAAGAMGGVLPSDTPSLGTFIDSNATPPPPSRTPYMPEYLSPLT